jgi:IstB transposition helper protein
MLLAPEFRALSSPFGAAFSTHRPVQISAATSLLFELTNRRYKKKSTVITTNKPFSQWHEVFPNAACVVSLIDRLIHNAEIIAIDGKSYRLKEAQERNERRAAARRKRKS